MAVSTPSVSQRNYTMVAKGLFMATCLMMVIWVYHGYLVQDERPAVTVSNEHEHTVIVGDDASLRNTKPKTPSILSRIVGAQDHIDRAKTGTQRTTAVCAIRKRLSLVEDVCSTLNNRDLAVKEDDYSDILHTFINHEQQIFCRIVSKAGSRALHGYFANLNRLDTSFLAQVDESGKKIDIMRRLVFSSVSAEEIKKLKGFNRIKNVPLAEVQRLYHNYTKLIQVRHPLQRFVSGYYEKVYQKIQNPDFATFVEEVLNGRSNGHWMPYYTNTYPCVLHYDVIIKVETSEHDQRVLKDIFGWESTIAHGHINPNFNITDATRSVYYKYDDFLKDFGMEHPSLFNRLLAFLQPDMDMFGYTWDKAGSSCYNSAANCC